MFIEKDLTIRFEMKPKQQFAIRPKRYEIKEGNPYVYDFLVNGFQLVETSQKYNHTYAAISGRILFRKKLTVKLTNRAFASRLGLRVGDEITGTQDGGLGGRYLVALKAPIVIGLGETVEVRGIIVEYDGALGVLSKDISRYDTFKSDDGYDITMQDIIDYTDYQPDLFLGQGAGRYTNPHSFVSIDFDITYERPLA